MEREYAIQVAAAGCGIAFELIPPTKNGGPWTEKMIYRFHGKDGASPVGVIFGANSDLYGSATAVGESGYPPRKADSSPLARFGMTKGLMRSGMATGLWVLQ
jgi:hypothetical protein